MLKADNGIRERCKRPCCTAALMVILYIVAIDPCLSHVFSFVPGGATGLLGSLWRFVAGSWLWIFKELK
jgi:hypothetical protein